LAPVFSRSGIASMRALAPVITPMAPGHRAQQPDACAMQAADAEMRSLIFSVHKTSGPAERGPFRVNHFADRNW